MSAKGHQGFTLLELVVGMVLLALALVIITGVLAPLVSQQREPLYQVRAAELAQALLGEIAGRSFDEHSDRSGLTSNNRYRYCGAISLTEQEESSGDCTDPAHYGPEGESYRQFNDVDDFNAYCPSQGGSAISGDDYASLRGLDPTLYAHFSLTVCVSNAPQWQGGSSRTDLAKRYRVTVTTPSGETLPFTGYRSNY